MELNVVDHIVVQAPLEIAPVEKNIPNKFQIAITFLSAFTCTLVLDTKY